MSKPPELLFRYRSWNSFLRRDGSGIVTERNYTKESLEQSRFYFSSPYDFDDLHDSLLGPHATGSPLDVDRFIVQNNDIFRLMRERKLSSITQLGTLEDEAALKVLKSAAGRNARRHTRVLCFTEDCLSELMWASYADYHRGICLGFETSGPFFSAIQPVKYLAAPADEPELSGAAPAEVDLWSLRKSKAWEFQREWRLVLPGDEPKQISLPKATLKLLVLGYRFRERDFDELKTVLMRGGYQVEIFRIERVVDSFKLSTIKVGEIVGPKGSEASGGTSER